MSFDTDPSCATAAQTHESPYAYAIDPAKGLIDVAIEGVVTRARLLKTLAGIQADPSFDERFDTLADYTAMTDLAMSVEDLSTMVTQHETEDRRQGRTAMVLGTHRHGRAFADLFEQLSSAKLGQKHRAFATRAEAEAWLGLVDLCALARMV